MSYAVSESCSPQRLTAIISAAVGAVGGGVG